MDVAGREPARRTRVAVRHGDHYGLLQPEDIAQVGVVGERMHDRQLGRAGIAEDLRHAFGPQQLDEGRAAADLVGLHPVGHEPCGTPWRDREDDAAT
jgi:hypothetical protein